MALKLTKNSSQVDKKRSKSIRIRSFILSEIENHERDIVAHVSQKFSISRQAAHKHVKSLIEEGILTKTGSKKSPFYGLKLTQLLETQFYIDQKLAEDLVWTNEVEPKLPSLPDNVFAIAHFAFTEILNNAIDHSEGSGVLVNVSIDARQLHLWILDNGIGIFHKLKDEFGLEDEKHGIFELAKGRLTTDPEKHSGEGIFWTSQMVDQFVINSGRLHFSSTSASSLKDVLIEDDEVNYRGTAVRMKVHMNSKKTLKNVFEQFAPESQNYGFTHTVLPVHLAQTNKENLISRSQAKRFLQRVDKFKDVIVDFTNVEEIGQAFADEIFRVFAIAHPDIKITPVKMLPSVTRMVNKALALKREQAKLGGLLPKEII